MIEKPSLSNFSMHVADTLQASQNSSGHQYLNHDRIIHYMELTPEDRIFLDEHVDVWKEGQPQ
jgi:hypothetical protein